MFEVFINFVLISFNKPDVRKTSKITFSAYEITSKLNYNFAIELTAFITHRTAARKLVGLDHLVDK